MEEFNFSDGEIRKELARLGYIDISPQRLVQFKLDLEKLVQSERSKDTSQNTTLTTHSDLDYRYSEGDSPRTHHITKHHDIQIHPVADIQCEDFSNNDLLRCGRIDMPPCYDQSLIDHPVPMTTSVLDETGSECGSYRRFLRRKTSRKAQDGSRTIDESVTESEPGDLENIDQRLRELGLRASVTRLPRSQSAIDPPYRLDPRDNRPPSVIYPTMDHPHTRNLRKNDPVARYQEMQQGWRQYHLPGEVDHKQLRWNIREMMVQRDPLPKKAQRTFVANNYVVPSNKKRNALRWQIRMDMARGNMPLGGGDE